MDGVVASPHEVGAIRKACGRRFLIVTPGIRPPRDARDDQKRVDDAGGGHPRRAPTTSWSGSPIRDAADPVAAARGIVAAMERGAAVSGALGA